MVPRSPRRHPFRMASLVEGLAAISIGVPAGLWAQGTGIVSGTVRDSLGGAIAGVEVTVDGSRLRGLTNERGIYRLIEVPGGAAGLTIRRLGFRPTRISVDVIVGAVTSMDVRLHAVAQRLAPIAIRERANASDSRLSGFNARRARNGGHFITRERIGRMNSFSFTDLLREVPGVRIARTRNATKSVRLRGASCAPLVFIDGSPASAGEFDLESVDLGSVEAVEVYSSSSTVPPELVGPRGLFRCGVIGIWSRPSRPSPRRQRGKRAALDLDSLIASPDIYTAEQVDVAVVPLSDGPTPGYPDSLWEVGVSGRVVAEFIVGADGLVEQSTVGIVSSTHPAFTEAVRSALEAAEFSAAILNGRAVRQVVQLPFDFEAPPSTRPLNAPPGW
jgi:TonB family protein